MATLHAKNRPPSAAKRWLSCPLSAKIVPMYPNDPTAASEKGDKWHDGMEDYLTFGTLPLDFDPDIAEQLEDLYAYVLERFKAAGPSAKIYIEVQLDIKETGEFGTGDIIIVCDEWIEVIDGKSGYVPVHVDWNDQMLTYLSGAVDRFGERPLYRLSVFQPNYDHVDGALRHWHTDADGLEFHRARLRWSVANPDLCVAGPHCKESYCPHRGACAVFHQYVLDDLSLGYHTSEVKGMDDATLAKALDAVDELSGYRDKIRSEAMKRILNMDRKIEGYKVVKGRRNRAVADANRLVVSVRDNMGVEWALKLFPSLAWVGEARLVEIINTSSPCSADHIRDALGTPKHIEDTLKQYARQHRMPRGSWKTLYDSVVARYIREQAGGLTLERAIDGRPAHKRGSEFGTITPLSEQTLIL